MWSGRGTLNGLLVAVKMAKFEHISGYAYALTRSDNNEFGEIFAEIGEDVG